MSDDFKFEIKETLCRVPSGIWNLELNLISWGDNEPKYDLRKWNKDHTKMSKGIGMSEEELKLLIDQLIRVNL
jgi:hypothetical protein